MVIREPLFQNLITTRIFNSFLNCLYLYNNILDNEILSQLAEYRKEFAHRLDSLDNLKRELDIRQPDDIKEMLDTANAALNSYYECLQNILGYTTSQHYLGVKGLRYDSLSRLKLAASILEK